MKLRVLCPLVFAFVPLIAAPLQPIFDGRTLDGWEGNSGYWRVEDGALTGEIPVGQSLAKNEFIFWRGEVHDFELVAEFRISGAPSATSGIQFRSERLPDGLARGCQAELDDGARWLGRINDEHGRGLIVERGTRVSIAPDGRRWTEAFATPESFRARVKPGEWNTYRMIATGSHIELWVNGTLWSSLDDHQVGAASYSGRLALHLQSGPGPAKIQFRSIRLAELGRTEFPKTPLPALAKPGDTVPFIPPIAADGSALNLNFETGTLAGWKIEGDAWAGQPLTRREGDPPQAKPTGHEGKFWIGYNPRTRDAGVGRLTSPEFAVTHRWASFLVGGGSTAGVRVEIVDATTGEVLKRASGTNLELMRREVIDFGDTIGRKIFIRLVDEVRVGWGHISFDDFVFHAEKPDYGNVALSDAQRPSESPVLWHLRPNAAAPTAVKNPEAQKVVAGMLLTSGFQAELIAAEPEVHQPIAFAFDERGRLWVTEAYSYPAKQPVGKGKDRIVIFEDTDGDGTFKTRKIFAEGLNLVSALEVGFGGVWVGAAPELLFIPDRDHDDKPDGPPEVLLDGWGMQDTHETLNSFSWGPDGWLYGNQGVFNVARIGKPGTPPEQRQVLRSGVWRYHPVRHEFEIFAHGGSNQWGIDFNDVGHLFMTHCRSFHGGGGTTFVMRNGHFWNQANANYAPFISNTAPAFAPALKNFLPASARYDSGEGGAGKPGTTAIYGGHSHVGTLLYLGDNWPDIYRNHLFTHNLHGRQMNQQVNVRTGSAYETFHAGADLMYTPDPSYVAVDLQTGPDGAVYIIDWVDLQHCHTPDEAKWDRTNGRIYRVSWAQTFHPVKVDLASKTDAELVALHTHKNEWFVRTARRLLQERAVTRKLDAAAIAALREQVRRATEPVAALRALWTLHVTGELDAGGIAAMLHDPADVVRAWGVQLATERPAALRVSADALRGLAVKDSSALVRLAVASALPELPSESRWPIISALAAHAEDADDRFLPKMIWFALADVAGGDVGRALAIAANTPLPSLADSIRWFAGKKPQGRELLAAEIARAPLDVASREARLLAFSVQSESALPMPAGWVRAAARFSDDADPSAHLAVEQLSAVFGDKAVLALMRTRLADPKLALTERRAAFEVLKRVGDREAIPLYVPLLEDNAFRSAVIPLLAGANDPAAGTALLRHFAQLNAVDRQAALNTLTSRPVLALVLLDAVQRQTIEKKNLTALHVRQLRNLGDVRVNQRLDEVWGKVSETSAEMKTTIARLKKTYEAAPLWAYSAPAGREVFQRTCAACHAINGQGGKLGPDLAGAGRNGIDYFLENIVDPNAVVGADYQLNVITKHDGTVLSGMIEKQTESALVLRTVSETTNVALAEIKTRQTLPQSIMPPGLLEALPERETIELLKFLTTQN